MCESSAGAVTTADCEQFTATELPSPGHTTVVHWLQVTVSLAANTGIIINISIIVCVIACIYSHSHCISEMLNIIDNSVRALEQKRLAEW